MEFSCLSDAKESDDFSAVARGSLSYLVSARVELTEFREDFNREKMCESRSPPERDASCDSFWSDVGGGSGGVSSEPRTTRSITHDTMSHAR